MNKFVVFALAAVALRTIRLEEEYDPARTQSNRTIRVHEIVCGSPVNFGMLIAEEAEKWTNVVKLSGAKAD